MPRVEEFNTTALAAEAEVAGPSECSIAGAGAGVYSLDRLDHARGSHDQPELPERRAT